MKALIDKDITPKLASLNKQKAELSSKLSHLTLSASEQEEADDIQQAYIRHISTYEQYKNSSISFVKSQYLAYHEQKAQVLQEELELHLEHYKKIKNELLSSEDQISENKKNKYRNEFEKKFKQPVQRTIQAIEELKAHANQELFFDKTLTENDKAQINLYYKNIAQNSKQSLNTYDDYTNSKQFEQDLNRGYIAQKTYIELNKMLNDIEQTLEGYNKEYRELGNESIQLIKSLRARKYVNQAEKFKTNFTKNVIIPNQALIKKIDIQNDNLISFRKKEIAYRNKLSQDSYGELKEKFDKLREDIRQLNEQGKSFNIPYQNFISFEILQKATLPWIAWYGTLQVKYQKILEEVKSETKNLTGSPSLSEKEKYKNRIESAIIKPIQNHRLS